MKNIIKNNKFSFLLVSCCLFLIFFIGGLVIIYDKLIIDTVVYEFLMNNFRNDFIDSFMINITKLGDTNFVLMFSGGILFVLLLILKNKILSIMYIFSVSCISIINQLLKFIFKRDRPDVLRLIDIGGYSFPSGHAMVSVVLYGLLAYIIYKSVKVKWLRNVGVFINCLIVFFIGVSRIYLGVHYFSDVIVGFSISVIFLVLIINLLEKKVFSQN